MKVKDIVLVKVRLVMLSGSCSGSSIGEEFYIMRQGFQELYKH